MNISIYHLVPALMLLWMPRQCLRWLARFLPTRHRKYSAIRASDPRNQRQPDDRSVWLREELLRGRNYIDLVRASVGSWLLMHGAFTLTSTVPSQNGGISERMVVFASQMAVLVVAVLIRMIRWEGKLFLFAPIFLLMGMTVGICGHTIAPFAAVLAWAFSRVLPNPETFLFVYAVSIAGFAVLFLHRLPPLPILLAAGLILLPAIISWLSREPLMLKSKHARREEGFGSA